MVTWGSRRGRRNDCDTHSLRCALSAAMCRLTVRTLSPSATAACSIVSHVSAMIVILYAVRTNGVSRQIKPSVTESDIRGRPCRLSLYRQTVRLQLIFGIETSDA